MCYIMECRVCYGENGIFVKPCKCKGDTNIHEHCLRKWIETSGRDTCEICHTKYVQKEVFSWQCRKYIHGCMNFSCTKIDAILFVSTFILSLLILMYTDIKDLFLMNSISSSCMYIVFIVYTVKNFEMFKLDTLFWWKLSYSTSLYIILVVLVMQSTNECFITCTLHSYQCSPSCPYFTNLDNMYFLAQKVFAFDFINLIVISMLRCLYICPKYHKKIVFDEYETEPLLADGDDQINHNC